MKYYFTHNNRKPLYRIRIWYKYQLNADELLFSNKKDAIKEWNKMLDDLKDGSLENLDMIVLVRIKDEYIERRYDTHVTRK